MEASTCHNTAPMISCYPYLHCRNVFSAFPFPKFESLQTIKLVSSKFIFAVLFLAIQNLFTFSCTLVAA